MLKIIAENSKQHSDAIEALYDKTFGPGHFAKTAERLRESNMSLPALNRVAVQDDQVIGVCRVWPIKVGDGDLKTLFIGPVAIDPDFRGQRLGLSVTGEALEAATKSGWDAALIIGAPDYFGELGFETVNLDRFEFPGPQDMARVMVRALAGDPAGLSGRVRAA